MWRFVNEIDFCFTVGETLARFTAFCDRFYWIKSHNTLKASLNRLQFCFFWQTTSKGSWLKDNRAAFIHSNVGGLKECCCAPTGFSTTISLTLWNEVVQKTHFSLSNKHGSHFYASEFLFTGGKDPKRSRQLESAEGEAWDNNTPIVKVFRSIMSLAYSFCDRCLLQKRMICLYY